MHPYMCASITLDRKEIGVIGRIHPKIEKDDIFVAELSMTKLMESSIKPLKYKPSSKYPSISKDVAFIVDKNLPSIELSKTIEHAGSRLLTKVEVFDVYTGDNIDKDKKSIAFNLTFEDQNKTLTEEEVMKLFENIIQKVCSSHNAILRDK